jgi:hypothetical protein
MGLGTNRDYKTRDIKATAVLKIHNDYMILLVEVMGLTKEDASKQAYEAVTNGALSRQIKAEEKRIRNRRNGRR